MTKQEAAQQFDLNEHIKKLRELISLHMHPYNLGDMGETETAIEKLIRFAQQSPTDAVALRKAIELILTEEITYSPQVQGFIIHGAIEKICALFNPAPQSVGPVWVKANTPPPRGWKGYVKYDDGDGGYCTYTGNAFTHAYVSEWLDQSGQQVFTREDMERAAGAFYMVGFPHQITPKDWMNTYYPEK